MTRGSLNRRGYGFNFGEFLLKKGTRVGTPEGFGVTLSVNMRKNTNAGKGARQYVVQLDDGRIRHYTISEVQEVSQ